MEVIGLFLLSMHIWQLNENRVKFWGRKNKVLTLIEPGSLTLNILGAKII